MPDSNDLITEQESLVILQYTGLVDPSVSQSMMLLNLSRQIESLEEKLDELKLAKLKAGFESIHTGLLAETSAGRRSHIERAETFLSEFAGLPIKGRTRGHSNDALVAWAHYGLAFTSSLLGENLISAWHILKAFQVAPRLSRLVLAPSVFENLFKPHCQRIPDHYARKIEKESKKIRKVHKKQEKAIRAVGKPIGIPINPKFVLPDVNFLIDEMVEKYEKREADKIDKICRQVAEERMNLMIPSRAGFSTA